MQIQKFDATKNHGVVYNHPNAQYEQNGQLYNAVGEPVDEIGEMPVDLDLGDLTAEMDFLYTLLAGGPVVQRNIKVESESKQLNWDKVLSAAAKMGVSKYKSGALPVWKLKEGA